MTADVIRAVDLFCGAGGLSWGLVQALREVAVDAPRPTDEVLEETIDLVGVNHWEVAIRTHEANHPWARHFHDDVQHVNPREVFDERDPDVTVLSGGIECTHWSTARGGKPVDDQKRMPAWDFLTWVQKLCPEHVLVENTPAFEDWGPIEDDGTPTRNGETFEQWVNALHSLGYSVDWRVLNAADYGDPTSRKRLFILATREGSPSFPTPTHAENPAPDDDRDSREGSSMPGDECHDCEHRSGRWTICAGTSVGDALDLDAGQDVRLCELCLRTYHDRVDGRPETVTYPADTPEGPAAYLNENGGSLWR